MTHELLRVHLLGEVQVVRGITPIPLGGGQRQALLALLALRAPRSLGRAEIIDALWGENPPTTAVNAVQVHVSALRKALGPDSVVVAGDGYRLGAGIGVDVVDFVVACRRGASELARGQAGAAETLRDALDLWRGPALAGLDSATFLAAERTHLEEARLTVLEQRIEADLQIGRHRDVAAELESLVAVHPLREGLRALLMQALYRSGRQAEALAVYDVGRRVLQEELGLDPSPALRAVHQRLLSQGEAVPVAPSLLTAARRELPALLDETVGREDELSALAALLNDGRGRLLSVLGTGGVGKTRLAIAVGHLVAGSTSQAVVLVPLGHAEKPADVPATMCQALGVRTGEDPVASLESALQAERTLLICDNFEHVLDAAPLLPRLLAVAPDLRVLVTTRQPLGLRGERLFPLHPLIAAGDAAEQPSPAARLFVARVQDADPTFRPTAEEMGEIAEIAQRCDGLPLALELAAARTRALPVAELNRRLSHPLSLLASGARDVPERHRTLRASIAWSVGALTSDQARFLAQLTVFRGGFTLQGVAAVTGCEPDVALENVEALLARSLIQRLPQTGGLHRFGMLETISEYAGELLDAEELTEAQRRHAEHYRDWMQPLPEPTRTGASLSSWQAQLDEKANLRQAVRWAVAGPSGDLAGDLVISAAWVWDQSGPQSELELWLVQLLERTDISAGRRCDAYWWQATLSSSGDLRLMASPLRAARSLAETHNDTRRLVWIEILSVLGEVLNERPQDALQAVRQGQALAAAHPETSNLHVSMLMLNGQLAAMEADPFASALKHRQHKLATSGGTSVDLRALIILHLSEMMLRMGYPARALRFADEGIVLAERMRSAAGVADSRSQRGYAQLLLGNDTQAIDDLRSALAGHLHARQTFYAGRDLLRLAAATAATHPEEAARAFGVTAEAPELAGGLRTGQAGQPHPDHLPADLLDRYDAAVAEGRALVRELGTRAAMAAVLNRFYALPERTTGR